MNRIALGLAASAAIAFASLASAAVTTTDYSFTGLGNTAGFNGTFSVAFDDVANTYSLDDLNFLVGVTLYDTSNSFITFYGPEYALYGAPLGMSSTSSIDDFFLLFEPTSAFPQNNHFVVTVASINSLRGGSATIDTINTAVPEPSTWAMMLLGFGAVGFAMRRRKRTELTFRRAA